MEKRGSSDSPTFEVTQSTTEGSASVAQPVLVLAGKQSHCGATALVDGIDWPTILIQCSFHGDRRSILTAELDNGGILHGCEEGDRQAGDQ